MKSEKTITISEEHLPFEQFLAREREQYFNDPITYLAKITVLAKKYQDMGHMVAFINTHDVPLVDVYPLCEG